MLIAVTSTIGIINPLLNQAVFNDALFVRGGPRLGTLYLLAGLMALVPVINAAFGLLQTYYTNRVSQQVMREVPRASFSSVAASHCCRASASYQTARHCPPSDRGG